MPQHNTTFWSVAIDMDNPLSSRVHTSANDAWGEIIEHYAETDKEREKAYAFVAGGDFDNLREYVAGLKETYHPADDYTVDKYEITLEVPGAVVDYAAATDGHQHPRVVRLHRSQVRRRLDAELGELCRGCRADAHARRDTRPPQHTLTQGSRQRFHFPLTEIRQVQKTLINGVRFDRRHH